MRVQALVFVEGLSAVKCFSDLLMQKANEVNFILRRDWFIRIGAAGVPVSRRSHRNEPFWSALIGYWLNIAMICV